MNMLWRDVFVPDHVVASDGFTAEVGGTVEMPLSLFCRFRTRVSNDDDRRPSVTSTPGDYLHTDDLSVYDLVGQAAAMKSTLWDTGWMLDVNGLGIYVFEADAGPSPGLPTFRVYREPGSDPAAPIPEPGTWTRVRGQLSVAEPYETEAFESQADLLRRAVRTWHVRRVIRLDSKLGKGHLKQVRAQDVAVIQYPDLRYDDAWTTDGYLLDLERVDRE
ncbi:hypothetical protein COUCH_11565 [Couchioplanes caeruleus]|uniref:hypothetical protein n=1 Tax=Couchioplanes caeruleus TaxID=56438 RepID=UPI0020BD5E3E|nr:hypothetical protein [Couchioplanes caeruleus]UQU66859.1 hypothetical protein COUCH_11565 [Couchioplanes caeruleus]